MKFNWKPHYLLGNDMRHAHHNGYSILWAKTPEMRFHLGGSVFEVMPNTDGDDGISRFNLRKEMEKSVCA